MSSIYEGGVELEAQPGVRTPARGAEGAEQQDEVHVLGLRSELLGEARSDGPLRSVRRADDRAGDALRLREASSSPNYS